MSYEEYLKESGINRDVPVEIEWSERDRGFYCPICKTGRAVDTKRCGYCGQLLKGYFNESNEVL